MGPKTSEEIMRRTHIPKDDLDVVLQKNGKNVDGKWQLTDRACKDLDVWKFEYPSQKDRQAAIDNAIKAYDRLRLGREERLWQMLLPKKDRGGGIVLSKLDLGAGPVNRALTPHYQPSPTPNADGAADSKAVSAANTPRLVASTPRPASSKGDVMKRLLSKDPKKARAAEEAKEKKRKDREAPASDREDKKPAKKQATKKTNVKSAEFVHSSDEESGEEGEVRQSKASPSKPNQETGEAATKSKPKAAASTSSDSSDTPLKSTAKAKSDVKPSNSTASLAVKPSKPSLPGKSVPKAAASNGLTAPGSQHKSQRSPQKADSRPNVPSPLGAARPRIASDISDRDAVGVQKAKQGADTPKGLEISIASRQRQDTVTSTESNASEKRGKEHISSEKRMATPKAASADGPNQKVNGHAKRKAEDSPSQSKDSAPAPKHCKTDSNSSQSQKSQPSSATATNGTARTSPDGLLDSSSSDSATSVIDSITYNQGVALAEKFRDTYYPAYLKLYDTQAATEARGEKVSKEERERLWAMHKRLEQMKREIVIASRRESED